MDIRFQQHKIQINKHIFLWIDPSVFSCWDIFEFEKMETCFTIVLSYNIYQYFLYGILRHYEIQASADACCYCISVNRNK